MNIKTGQILKYKDGQSETKVLAIVDEVALLSLIGNFEVAKGWYTFKEIENHCDLSKEKWVPRYRDCYWFVGDEGKVDDNTWGNDRVDDGRYEFNNVFRTKKEAEEALEKVKEVLKK